MRERNECLDFYGCLSKIEDAKKNPKTVNPFTDRPRKLRFLKLSDNRVSGELVREGLHFRRIVKRLLPKGSILMFRWNNLYLVREYNVGDCLR